MNTPKPFIKSVQGKTFVFVAICVIVLTAGITLNKWESLQENTTDEMRSIFNLVKESVRDRVKQQELLLKVMGNRLQLAGGLDNPEEMFSIFDSGLRDNPVYLAYGIVDPDGQMVYLSDTNATNLPNLASGEFTKETYEKALASDKIVIGNTYYTDVLKEWIIPMRIAIRGDDGEVDFMLVVAIGLDSEFNPWKLDGLSDGIHLLVAHSPDSQGDYYLIYYEDYSIFADIKEDVYYQPVTSAFIENADAQVRQKLGISLADMTGTDVAIPYMNTTEGFEPALVFMGVEREYGTYLAVRYYTGQLKKELWVSALSTSVVSVFFLIFAYLALKRLYQQDVTFKTKLQFEATHDQLTGLYNRYFLQLRFPKWRKKNSNQLAVFFIDLDNFKFINDHFGDSTGDTVLEKTASNLKSNAPDNAIVVRQGGDQFLVIVPFKNNTEIEQLANHLLHISNAPIFINDLKVSISASIGVSNQENASEAFEPVVARANLAMTSAKKQGNQWCVFSEELQLANKRKSEIGSALATAIADDEFSIAYQAQVDSGSQELRGFEALLRWKNKDLGQVGPDEFIPVLESSGKIVQVGEHVICKVFDEFGAIAENRSLRISVNVSVHQIIYGDFRSFINRQIAKTKINPKQVVIEVTESLFIEDINQVSSILHGLRSDGFLISLDDFGTGYSSLGTIRTLPFSELKIDRSFVSNVITDEADRTLVNQIIKIGHNQQTQVVAEGVESLEQVKLLHSLGCDLLQGYYFCKPIPMDEILVKYTDEI